MALTPEQAFRAECDRHQRLMAVAHPEVRQGPSRELVLAADQFLIAPTGRQQDAAWAKAAGLWFDIAISNAIPSMCLEAFARPTALLWLGLR